VSELLVLFDLDGTLLLDDAYAHGRAMVQAMRDVYGVELPDAVVVQIDPYGKTDLRIAREALHTRGLDDRQIDERCDAWIQAAADAFEHELERSTDAWSVRPGLKGGLSRLNDVGMRLGLLTGNLRAIARSKLEYLEVTSCFDLGTSAYGDDTEERTALVPIARERAGSSAHSWPRERTVVVGDTPGDMAAARADEVACAIFSSPRFPAGLFGDAQAVVMTFEQLNETLEEWQTAGVPQPS